MKKTIISVVIATILGMQSTTLKANSFSSHETPWTKRMAGSLSETETSKVSKAYETRQKRGLQEEPQYESINRQKGLVSSAKKKLEILEKQLTYYIKIYESIIGSRRHDIVPRVNITTPYFHSPHLIYKDKTNFSRNLENLNVPKAEDIVIEQDLSFLTNSEARTFIEKRREYAAIVDKAISLQVFEETEARFKYIENLLDSMKNMDDLKWIAELQGYVEGTVAVIYNEATKLQMVVHLRNTEQELIRQQKYKRNIRILNHQNTRMPTVKYVKVGL
ncbi:type IV secretion system protein [Bartonella pachyuromydis]|uniref:Uncharacterized protein n=1 Tax=Bartonella pachyuromydis TaxID=931097 RepID=A0ABP8VCA2_9HYPH